jgi:hypothetical protein
VIHGCYQNNNGSLRVIDSDACKNNETALSWGQVGPSGPAGPQGETGPVGPTGPQGPAAANADAFHHKGPVVDPISDNEITGLRNIPTGNYIVMATVDVVSDTSSLGTTCLIRVNGDDFFTVPVGSTLVREDGGYGLATMTTAVNVPHDDSSISVHCGSSDGDAQIFGEIVAMQVSGTMHFQ